MFHVIPLQCVSTNVEERKKNQEANKSQEVGKRRDEAAIGEKKVEIHGKKEEIRRQEDFYGTKRNEHSSNVSQTLNVISPWINGNEEGIEKAYGMKRFNDNKCVSTRDIFPVKLHYILSVPEYQDIITWLPHGRSWKVLQPDVLKEKIIPRYFTFKTFASFVKQAFEWGFSRVTYEGQYTYYLKGFCRETENLCHNIRLHSKDTIFVPSRSSSVSTQVFSKPISYNVDTHNKMNDKKVAPKAINTPQYLSQNTACLHKFATHMDKIAHSELQHNVGTQAAQGSLYSSFNFTSNGQQVIPGITQMELAQNAKDLVLNSCLKRKNVVGYADQLVAVQSTAPPTPLLTQSEDNKRRENVLENPTRIMQELELKLLQLQKVRLEVQVCQLKYQVATEQKMIDKKCEQTTERKEFDDLKKAFLQAQTENQILKQLLEKTKGNEKAICTSEWP